MARPQKHGLDYFPLDVSFDDEVDLIEAEHGLEGFAILMKLWQKIYCNGYYIIWNDDAKLLFSKKINSELTRVSSVVNACLLRNLFDNRTYKKYGILTSRGIQRRYLTACISSKRKNITFVEDFFLLEDSYKKLIPEFTRLTPEETTINSEETPSKLGFTHEESTQSKVKESKVKESKVVDDGINSRVNKMTPEEFYNDNFSPINSLIAEKIKSYIDDGMEDEVIISAMRLAIIYNKKSWGYINSILGEKLSLGIKTIEQWDEYENSRQEKKVIKRTQKEEQCPYRLEE